MDVDDFAVSAQIALDADRHLTPVLRGAPRSSRIASPAWPRAVSLFRNGARQTARATVGGVNKEAHVSPFRRIALFTSLAAVLAIAALTPTALAGMHPRLAARLA